MLIFGTETIDKPQGAPLIKWCPKCDCYTEMLEFRTEEYFTFMFVIKTLQKAHNNNYLRCLRCNSPNPLVNRDDDSPFAQKVMDCPTCREKMRIPLMGRDITVKCPHCKTPLRFEET